MIQSRRSTHIYAPAELSLIALDEIESLREEGNVLLMVKLRPVDVIQGDSNPGKSC